MGYFWKPRGTEKPAECGRANGGGMTDGEFNFIYHDHAETREPMSFERRIYRDGRPDEWFEFVVTPREWTLKREVGNGDYALYDFAGNTGEAMDRAQAIAADYQTPVLVFRSSAYRSGDKTPDFIIDPLPAEGKEQIEIVAAEDRCWTRER